MEVYDEFVKECGVQNNWIISTYKKSVVKNHLRAFDTTLSPGAVDEVKLANYVNYLREVKDMRNVTIGKQIGFLK